MAIKSRVSTKFLRGTIAAIGIAAMASASINTGQCFSSTTDASKNIYMTFDNGDTGEIKCDAARSNCRIKINIYKHIRELPGESTAAIGELIPDYLELVPVQQSPEEFGLGVHLWCPEKIMATTADVECYANVTVREGKITAVRPYFIRKQVVRNPGETGRSGE